LFLAVPSPSQTFSIITVLSDLYKSHSSSLWHYFLTASYLYTNTTFWMFPNTWNLCCVAVSDHSLHPNRTVGKIIYSKHWKKWSTRPNYKTEIRVTVSFIL
jgi:hypothetical protein